MGRALKETADQIASVNRYADAAGPPHPRIRVSFRPIVAPTDELAWEKAHDILARTKENIAASGLVRHGRAAGAPQNVWMKSLVSRTNVRAAVMIRPARAA